MSTSFLVDAIAYLLAALVCVPIAKRLGLGSVLGYLVAGIAIGPALLGIIGEQGTDIMHFAEFGVVIMLFLIGLELEPRRLWQMRTSVGVAGSLQLALTTVAIGAGAMLLGLPWQVSLAVALALSMSSTAIVLQSLKEQGLMHTSAGRTSFAVLLFQDVAVIPILALLPFLATGVGQGASDHTSVLADVPALLRAVLVLAAVAVVVVAGRFAVVPMMRAVASARQRELFIAASLLIVGGIAWLMMMVGLSPALGTFLAGVVLSDSEFRHELESDLEPVKGLFLGLFFIAVGASIDVASIAAQPLATAAIVLGLVAIKAAVLVAVGRFVKLSLDQTLLFAIGMAQVGEFAFVLLSFSVQSGVVPPHVSSSLMAATAISMALTPLLVLALRLLVLPRIGTRQAPTRQADDISEHHNVIIVGFSHFGSTIGRLLRANGIEATILDNDSDRVDLLRRMGFRVYYGDATRADLLAAAGAEQASMLICAVGSQETTNAIVELAGKHFPHLQLLVRARDRFHAYELMEHGVAFPYRDGVETAVRMGVDALRATGRRAYAATRAGSQFLRYDEASMAELATLYRSDDDYVGAVRRHVAEQERLLTMDIQADHTQGDHAWDSEPMRKGVSRRD